MNSKFFINAAWEVKVPDSPCRWFIVWKEISSNEISGSIAGSSGGGTFMKEKFYAKHKNGVLESLWVDFTDLVNKEEIDFQSLSSDILEIADLSEDELWTWNDVERWIDDEQIFLQKEKFNDLTPSDDMIYYSTGTTPFLLEMCELNGLTAGPKNTDYNKSHDETGTSGVNRNKIEVKSTMTVKEFKQQLEDKYEVLTPKGNVAGDERKLRAMTEMDISKGKVLYFEANESLSEFIYKNTGVKVVLIKDIKDSNTNSNDLVVKVAISRDASEEYDTTGIGCEIVIGRLSKDDIQEIINLVKEDRYFDWDSRFISEWREFSEFYHEKGLLLTDAKEYIIDELNILEKHSTENWEFDAEHIENGFGLNKINLPSEGTFLISIRNEDFALIGNVALPKNDSKFKVKLYYDYIEQLSTYDSVKFTSMGIVRTMQIGDKNLEIDTELPQEIGDTFPYDINQFIIHNGKILAWFNDSFNDHPKLQWYIGYEENLPYLSEYLKNGDFPLFETNKEDILSKLLTIN